MKNISERIKIVAVTGPTATGKTTLGIHLAQHFQGEIVSCDSMQIYKGLPIGTAQPTERELKLVRHHLIGFLDPTEGFSVSDYVKLAGETVQDIFTRGKLPILVGGTGLYARSLLQGTNFEEACRDDLLRESLYRQASENGNEAVYQQLMVLDPQAAQKIHPHNLKRVVRALEYCILTDGLFSAQELQNNKNNPPYEYLMLCLTYRNREVLYREIERRVDKMLEQGLLSEAEAFYRFSQSCERLPTAAQAIGYKELFPYFSGKAELEDAIANLKKATRHYAKRQMTWFKKESAISFIYLDDYDSHDKAIQTCIDLVNQFLE